MKLYNILLALVVQLAVTLAGKVYKVSSTADIKTGPGSSYSTVNSISANKYIYATEVSSGWAKFYKGYVKTSNLVAMSGSVNYQVSIDTLVFRAGPNTSYDSLTELKKGKQIIYYGKDPWSSGWAVTNKGYCTISKDGKYYITRISTSTTTTTKKSTTTTKKTTTTTKKTTTTSKYTSTITNAGDISTKFDGTLLSRKDFITKMTEYCKANPGRIAEAMCTESGAGTVYDVCKKNDVNALVSVARAITEGNSPGAYKNNYWGIGCSNGGGNEVCFTYTSLTDGLNGFAKAVSKYNNLTEMHAKYAFIGRYWFNPGGWSDGGCKYYPYIKQYMSSSRAKKVGTICGKTTTCVPPSIGDCTATNQEDQDAYAAWQVEQKMGPTIREIFGVY